MRAAQPLKEGRIGQVLLQLQELAVGEAVRFNIMQRVIDGSLLWVQAS